MLIGSNLNSDFGPLPSAPWNMEPPRLPLSAGGGGGGGGGGSLPQSTNIPLSPTGKQTVSTNLPNFRILEFITAHSTKFTDNFQELKSTTKHSTHADNSCFVLRCIQFRTFCFFVPRTSVTPIYQTNASAHLLIAAFLVGIFSFKPIVCLCFGNMSINYPASIKAILSKTIEFIFKFTVTNSSTAVVFKPVTIISNSTSFSMQRKVDVFEIQSTNR